MPDPAFVAAILAKNQVFTAWDNLTIRRDFHDGISVFAFVPAENAYGEGNRDLLLQPGDPVAITLGGRKVISGKVTGRSLGEDAQSHQVVINGKSFTKDVADSSVPIKPGSYDGATFSQIARAILAPHKTGLKFRNPPAGIDDPFPSFSIKYGETGGEVLNRMAAMRGAWIGDDADGNVVVGQGNPGSSIVAELREGVNILRFAGRMDDDTAFGKYAAVGQVAGADSTQLQRWHSVSQSNPNVPENRYNLGIAPHPDTATGLTAYLGRQVAQSLWQTVQCTVTVVGWFRPDGLLWEPTDNVSIYMPSFFPNDTGLSPKMGILSCTYAQDAVGGTTTALECVLPQFMTSIPSAGLSDAPATPEAGAPAPARTDAPDYAGRIST